MPTATAPKRTDIEVCEHSLNIKYCQKCQAALKEKNKPSITQRILDVIKDGRWYTQRQIAEIAGLMEGDSYIDIGRDLRNMRADDFGGHPIDERQSADDKMIHEYKLILPDETELLKKYEEKRAARLAKARAGEQVVVLEEEVKTLTDRLQFVRQTLALNLQASEEEIKFLKEYIAELENENALLKGLRDEKGMVEVKPTAAVPSQN